MRPLLVLILVLSAIGALLFLVFNIDDGTKTPKPVETTSVPSDPAVKPGPSAPTTLVGDDGEKERVPQVPLDSERVQGGPANADTFDNKLVGQVVNREHQPVAGAQVILTTLGSQEVFFVNDSMPDLSKEPSKRTDAEGRFSFIGVVPRERYTLIVEHPDYARKEVQTVPIADSGTATEPEIVLAPGATLTGLVRDEGGNNVDDATLHLEGFLYQGLGAAAPDRITIKTDKEGRYTFKNVPKGQRMLTVSAPGYGQVTITGLAFDKEEALTRDVILKVGEMICGRVIDDIGQGVPNATVIAVGLSSTQQSQRGQATTNEKGEFCLETLLPGDYNVIAKAKGLRQGPRPNRVPTNSQAVIIEMFKEASVSGRVLDAVSGNPLPSFTVRIRFWYGADSPTAQLNEEQYPVQNANGEFTIEGVPAGDFVVEALAPGYAPGFSSNFQVQQGKPIAGIVVRLGAGGSISGRVVDPDGKPVGRARILTRDNDWVNDAFTEALGFSYPTNATSSEVRSKDDGTFTIPYLNPQTYQINVIAAGFTTFMKRDITVGDGAIVQVGDLKLSRGGIVRGTLYDAAGKPVSGGNVRLNALDGDFPANYSSKSGTDGKFVFTSVAPGRYTLSGMRPGAGEANPFAQIQDEKNSEKQIGVQEGEPTTQDLQLIE